MSTCLRPSPGACLGFYLRVSKNRAAFVSTPRSYVAKELLLSMAVLQVFPVQVRTAELYNLIHNATVGTSSNESSEFAFIKGGDASRYSITNWVTWCCLSAHHV